MYDSKQPPIEGLPNYQAAYRRLIAMSRTPWARLVVDIVAERLNVIGFRVGEADDLIWTMLRRSHMEALQNQVHREAINLGTSYVSMWPDNGMPKLAWESALTMTHETEPGDPHTVAAAFKVWEDTIRDRWRVNLYLPDAIHKWQSKEGIAYEQTRTRNSTQNSGEALNVRYATLLTGVEWEQVESLDNPYKQVPVVPFVVRPNWDGYGQSDLDDLGAVLKRIEFVTTNILLAVELGAFRQRWATGIEVPLDPITNQPVEPFKVALDRLWVSEDDNAKFGSFEATDITGYLKAVSDAIGQLSATSRIPVTYFVQSELANPPSAASLEAAETGLIHKVIERQETFGESWEQVVKLVMRMANDAPAEADAREIDVLWKDPRTRSDSQTLDAAVKLNSIGMPWKAVMEFVGYSPEQIERMETDRMADTFNRLLNSPVPNAPQLATGQAPGQPPPGTAAPPGQ